MSIETLPQVKPDSLTLEIPSSIGDGTSSTTSFPSSSSSSSQSSPTGILDHTPSTRTSTSSFRSQNIQFAPLPEIGPRKRKSSAPLGMAARRQLVERRRQRMQQMSGSPMWTDEEIEKQARRASSEDTDEEEDPFLVLGRFMKDTGKQLWKKMAGTKEPKSKGEDAPPVFPTSSITPLDDTTTTSAIGTTPTLEKDVEPWSVVEQTGHGETDLSTKKEDEYDSEFGTQTIVDGHTKYSWVRGKADELATCISTQTQKIEIPPLPFEVSKPSFQAL